MTLFLEADDLNLIFQRSMFSHPHLSFCHQLPERRNFLCYLHGEQIMVGLSKLYRLPSPVSVG